MLKTLIGRLYSLSVLFGFDPKKTVHSLRGLPVYFRNLRKLRSQAGAAKTQFPLGRPYPCLSDRYAESGTARSAYFHQDLLVAHRIFQNSPSKHVDVGSRIDGFIAHVASFRKIEVFDIRPLTAEILNVSFGQLDLMDPLPESHHDYCDSLSCLHTIEHFGLGRYGDRVDYDGYLVGLQNLGKLLTRQGKFYFSTPIGPLRIEFDAHRVFSIEFLLKLFEPDYEIDHFSYVDDQGRLHIDVPLNDEQISTNLGCRYGCGIFEMTKR